MISQRISAPVVLDSIVSRRTLLRQLRRGGVAAVGLALIPDLASAQASPMASPAAIPPLLQDWAAALSSGDAARVAALFTDDAFLEDLAFGARVRGGRRSGRSSPASSRRSPTTGSR